MNTSTEALPSEDQVISWFEELSNWGRWGSEDQLGTLNLITEEKRRAAAALVRVGRLVSCARDIDTGLQADDHAAPPMRLMTSTGQGLRDPHRVARPGIPPDARQGGASEFLGMHYHGFRITHLDALSHMFWDGRMYNDHPAELVSTFLGATALDVRGAGGGVLTRGILVDVPRFRGVDWLNPGQFVTPGELQAIVAAEGVTPAPGDAVLLRTGYGRRLAEHGPDAFSVGHAGLQAACLPWYRHHDVAMSVADIPNDVFPSGYPGMLTPFHAVAIVAMGMWLLDNCTLEALAATCEELSTWEFQFIVAPMRFTGASGSPVNPLAVF